MIDTEQLEAVTVWLLDHSRQPKRAVRAWLAMLTSTQANMEKVAFERPCRRIGDYVMAARGRRRAVTFEV